jgi:hypothetical protein
MALSISESEDSEGRGYPSWQINRTTLQIAAALIGQGACVVFGHDWREDGVMEAVHAFAQQLVAPVTFLQDDTVGSEQPLLRNILPWPDRPSLKEDEIRRLASTLRLDLEELPQELITNSATAIAAGAQSPAYRYLRARSLTHLRRRLVEVSCARFCAGGRRYGYEGRYPGIVEESLLTLRAGQPLYLAGLLGGATRDVINAIQGKQMPPDFCRSEDVQKLFDAPPFGEGDHTTEVDRQLDPRATWIEFEGAGRTGVAAANSLTLEENEELFETPVLDRVIQLVVAGIARSRS